MKLLRWPQRAGLSHLVARRNADVYFLAWKTDFLPPLLEPIIFLGALGFGLGQFIPDVDGESYAHFLAPALIAITAMNAAFFECSYGSFVRMYWQKTYDAIIATPVSLDEVILGELLWGAAKSAINGAIVLLVVSAFGLVDSAVAIGAIPIVFLAAWTFGGIGVLTTSLAPNFDAFNYPLYLYVTPMMFLSGTFFPIETLPPALQFVAYALPLSHATLAARELLHGTWSLAATLSVGWLLVVGLIISLVAVNSMKRRLIK